jgi:hypothetical protein
VHELARTARCSGGPVLPLDDDCVETAARGIQRDSGSRDTATDDKNIEFTPRFDALYETLRGALASCCGEPIVWHGIPVSVVAAPRKRCPDDSVLL